MDMAARDEPMAKLLEACPEFQQKLEELLAAGGEAAKSCFAHVDEQMGRVAKRARDGPYQADPARAGA